MPRTVSQGIRYLVSGAANSVLTFALYQLLIIIVPYQLAYTLSFVAGIAFAARVNAQYVFSSRLTSNTALRFGAFYLLLYVFGLSITVALIEYLDFHERLAPLATVVLLLPVGFIGSRYLLSDRPLS